MTAISTLGQALDQISRLKTQQVSLDTLSTQLATGKKTQQFSGLGDDILRTQRARADIHKLEQYNDNIINGDRRIELMNNSMQQMIDQVDNILNALTVGVQQGDGPDFDTTQKLATDLKDFMIDLINSQDGDRYLFSGSDSSVKPVEDNGEFRAFLGTFVPDLNDVTAPPLQSSGFIGEWGNGVITTDEFITAYRSTNENIIGYSESLVSGSTGEVRIRVDENSDFEYTVLGNSDGMKNILIGLSVLESLPPVENAPGALNDPTITAASDDIAPFPSEEKQDNFYQVLNDVAALISNGVDDIRQEQSRLALVQAQTNLVKEQHTYQINSFQTIISEIEDVDLTETATKIQQAQVSLQASFQVTALVSDLTLVNFLR